MESSDDLPRRVRVDQWTYAEHVIATAMTVVEGVGADVRLTDAVVLLQAAKDSVADFVDDVDRRRFVDVRECTSVRDAGCANPRPNDADAYGYLSRLLKHYAPQCEPLPSLCGLCTQIDNLMVGLAQGELNKPAWWRVWLFVGLLFAFFALVAFGVIE